MAGKSLDSFGTRSTLKVGTQSYEIYKLNPLGKAGFKDISRLPLSLKILLGNLLRQEDGLLVTKTDIEALAGWNPNVKKEKEIAIMPARILTQDLTGVPAIVDLAVMREAMKRLGGDPKKINPLAPIDLVIDHSVQVDAFGSSEAFHLNSQIEYERNIERYAFLRWGQNAFSNFRVVPPDTGICHQINLEYLGQVVFCVKENGATLAYPDTVVGMDSHTPMINGLGIVGWGVGGIEAEAAMLGQPLIILIPDVIGFKLHGRLPEGATSTDLVLTVVQILRKEGVVEKFVEFYGAGLSSLSIADRATIGNMSPEYGATIGYFPVDDETLKFLELTGRSPQLIELVEAYCKEQGLFRTDASPDPVFTDTPDFDLDTVAPSLAGPKRPPDRVPLTQAKQSLQDHPELHEHFQSLRNDRRGSAREKSRRKGPQIQTMGKNEPCPRIEGGHGLSQGYRSPATPGEARLLPCRLWLHHLPRQQRPPSGTHFCRDSRRGFGCGGCSLRQPQLRGADSSPGQG